MQIAPSDVCTTAPCNAPWCPDPLSIRVEKPIVSYQCSDRVRMYEMLSWCPCRRWQQEESDRDFNVWHVCPDFETMYKTEELKLQHYSFKKIKNKKKQRFKAVEC